MAGEWREVTIGDLVWLHDQQITPASAPAEQFYHYSIPAYDSGQRPARETGSAIGSNKFVVPRGAVLVSKLNPRLPRVWAPDIPDKARAVASTEFLVLRPRDGVDRRFLKYLMLSPAVRSAMEARVTGTSGSHQRVPPSDLLSISVEIPVDLQEQRAIAHILGTLDDKIELNRRMSQTLEAMARALFKAWFVDFEPVRWKMERKGAKAQSRNQSQSALASSRLGGFALPPALAALFPDRLVDSALGPIPEGWNVGTLAEIFGLLRDHVNPLSEPASEFLHFSIPAFDEGQWPKLERGEEIKSQKWQVPPGVVLLSKLNPEIERVWLVDVKPDDRAVCSTEFLVLRPKPPYGRSYVYCLTRSPLFRQQIEGLVTGTSKSHQRAQPGAILQLAAIKPPAPLVTAFDRAAASLLNRTLEFRRESRTLAALRDALLPKLISGELRVKNIEEMIGRIV